MFCPLFLLMSLVVVGLISGAVNGDSLRDFGAALQAGFRWFIPFLLVWAAISALPKTLESNSRLTDSFILVYGILVPVLILLSALFTSQLTQLMGWDPSAVVTEEAGAGFTRGFTPIGSGISSGVLALFAYSIAFTGLMKKNRVLFNSFVSASLSSFSIKGINGLEERGIHPS